MKHRRAIVRTPGVCGGNARIYGTRISVWILERMRLHGMGYKGMHGCYFWVSKSKIKKAIIYARQHRDEIHAQIAENETDAVVECLPGKASGGGA